MLRIRISAQPGCFDRTHPARFEPWRKPVSVSRKIKYQSAERVRARPDHGQKPDLKSRLALRQLRWPFIGQAFAAARGSLLSAKENRHGLARILYAGF